MKFLSKSFRSALSGGLFAAVLLGLPATAKADFVTIVKTGTPVPGGDTWIALLWDSPSRLSPS